MSDNNVVIAMPPALSAPDPVPTSMAAAAPPPDDAIGTAGWLREMRAMRQEQQQERERQTDAFVQALDKLGGRIDANVADLRVELRRHLNVLVVTFILSLAVLGGLAGVGVYFKGLGLVVQAVPASAP